MSPFDDQVRAADEDRWLAARFVVDPARRAELVALYALNLDLARVAGSVKTPLMGEIRLEWWREGLAELSAGLPARAPVLEELRRPAREGRLDLVAVGRIIEARRLDLEPEPFPHEPALEGYLDDTAGALMAAAARLLDPAASGAAVTHAGRGWGWASWLRAAPAMAAAGRRWTPGSWGEPTPAELSSHVVHRVTDAITHAGAEVRLLSAEAFPAVAYAVLARGVATGVRSGPLNKRARLTWAVLRGWF